MNIKIGILALLVAIGTVIFLASKSITREVCVQNYVSANGKVAETGTYLCFEGGKIDREVGSYDLLGSKEKVVLELIRGANNPESLISANRVDLSNVKPGKEKEYVKAIYEMWAEIENKHFLFYADHDDFRKFVLSGKHKEKSLLLQIELTKEGEKLRAIRSKNDFSKMLARWHVQGADFPKDELQLSFLSQLFVYALYDKLCPDDNYCVYYRGFDYADIGSNLEAVSVWNKFLSGFAGGNASEMLDVIDSGSLKRLRVDTEMTSVPKAVDSLGKWFFGQRPIAFLYGENFLICYIAKETEGKSVRDSYLDGEGFPVLFYKDSETSNYKAIELNRVNVLKEFFRKADFENRIMRN